MKLHLIQPQEPYGPPERIAELLQVWEANAAIFDSITKVQGRPDFTELFAMCRPDHVNVIANSDIYFDHTLRENSDTLDPDQCWALSRWEDLGGTTLLPYHRSDSQDAWVVRGGPWTVDAPFPMGIPGCDNAIAYELKAMGLEVLNPCRTVHAIHLHTSGYRTYGEGRGKPKAYSITPPYHMVQPCQL